MTKNKVVYIKQPRKVKALLCAIFIGSLWGFLSDIQLTLGKFDDSPYSSLPLGHLGYSLHAPRHSNPHEIINAVIFFPGYITGQDILLSIGIGIIVVYGIGTLAQAIFSTKTSPPRR